MTEAEAVRLLRRHLVETKNIANDCITLIGDRAAGDYVFRAFDRCAEARLGRWRIDPSSGDASLHSTAAAP